MGASRKEVPIFKRIKRIKRIKKFVAKSENFVLQNFLK